MLLLRYYFSLFATPPLRCRADAILMLRQRYLLLRHAATLRLLPRLIFC